MEGERGKESVALIADGHPHTDHALNEFLLVSAVALLADDLQFLF